MSFRRNIKNIVFDFGGVLLNIDYKLTYEAIESLLGITVRPERILPYHAGLLSDYETGKMNTETFIWNLQHISNNKSIQGRDIIKAWNAMLLGWDAANFDLLLQLRKRYSVFLLSNTNELHMDWVYRDLLINHGITDFESRYFDKTYYSHQIHFKKPDPEIYKYVTDVAGINPDETLFMDDIESNVAAAKDAGWKTYHHTPGDNLQEICLKKLKLL
jgi:putative hydrolase of the HAD superfamily